MEIRLSAFHWSTIPPKQFIIQYFSACWWNCTIFDQSLVYIAMHAVFVLSIWKKKTFIKVFCKKAYTPLHIYLKMGVRLIFCLSIYTWPGYKCICLLKQVIKQYLYLYLYIVIFLLISVLFCLTLTIGIVKLAVKKFESCLLQLFC